MLQNAQIAARLREAGDLLQAQGANPFRVSAYRRAADAVEALTEPVDALYGRSGVEGLKALRGIGAGIAAAIEEMLGTGRWTVLERLRGATDPGTLFQAIPGVGASLAQRIHETLHVDSLEGLEAAAHDGRLRDVPGVGARRAAAIRAALTEMLDRTRPSRRRPTSTADGNEPSVDDLLDVDRQYREQAAAGALPTIAPRRFNPAGTSWLPVLHTTRGAWHYTALFSNTAKAHELGKTHDWVVVYFYDDQHVERQRTVVTESRGALAGRRVVRGRESECADRLRRGAA